MLQAADLNKKRKKDKNSPGLNGTEAKRQVQMSQKTPVVQKPPKDKGKSQDVTEQYPAISPYIMPASFPYQQQYPAQFNSLNPHFVQNPG